MARKYLTPIDLTGLELTNFKVQNLSSDPTAYGKGHTYYNTTHNELRVYDGSSWQPVGGAIAYGNTASRPAAGNAGNAYADTQTQTLYIDNGTAWVQIGVNPNDLSTAISNAALANTDGLSEGTTNLYFTTARAREALSASGGIDYNSSTGAFTVNYTNLESQLVTDGFAKTSDIPTAQSITNEVAADLVTGATYLTTGTSAGNTYVDLNLSTLESQLTTDGFAHTSDIPSLTNYIQTGDNASLTSLTLTHNGGSGENLKIGDDAWLGDVNLPNTFNVKGVEDATQGFISFGTNGTLVGVSGPKNNYVGFDGSDVSIGSSNDIILTPTSGHAYIGTPLMDGSNRIAKLSDISGNYISSVDSNIFNVSSGTLQLNSVVSFNDGELHLKKTEYWYGGDVSGTQEGVIEAHSDGTFRVTAVSNNLVLESNNGWLSLAGDSGVESLSNFQTTSGNNITSGNNLYVKNGIYAGGTDTSTDGYLYIQDASGNNLVSLSGTAGAGLIETHGTVNLYRAYGDGGAQYAAIHSDGSNNLIINAADNDLILQSDHNNWAYLGSVADGNRIATQSYVDGVAQGLNVKLSVRVASSAAVPLDGTATAVDGVTLADGDRVLLKDQSTASDNGIYVYTLGTTTLARATDEGTPAKGDFVFVEEGTHAAQGWILSATPGTWTQFSAAGEYTAGDGISIDAGSISVKLDSDSLSKSGTGLKLNIKSNGGLDNDSGVYVKTANGVTVDGSGNVTIDTDVVVRKYAATIGDGSATSYAVTHNLGTRDVQVAVYDSATYEEVITDITRTNTNTVTIGFAVAPASGAYRVVVHA